MSAHARRPATSWPSALLPGALLLALLGTGAATSASSTTPQTDLQVVPVTTR